MTMLFAFTSPSHDTTFLGSDDLNSLTGKRTDKVRYMFGRYLVGVIGSGIAFEAIAWNSIYEIEKTRFRDGTTFQRPENTLELFARLEVFLLNYAIEARKDHERFQTERDISIDKQQEHKAQHSKLLVCDAKEYSMHLVDFGNPFDPDNDFKANVQTLNSDTAYRVSDEAQWLGPVDAEMARDPEAWCNRVLRIASDNLAKENQSGILGDMGACAHVTAGTQQFRTSFDSIEDFYRNHRGLD
jgi:hypothetical protein